MIAATPTRTTLTTWLPCPRSDVPLIVTTVPISPDVGLTVVIAPMAAYVHPATSVENAPVSAVTTTSPLVAPWLTTLTTIDASDSD